MWEWEHKDGSVAKKRRGQGSGCGDGRAGGPVQGGTVGAEMVSGEGGKRGVVKGRGGRACLACGEAWGSIVGVGAQGRQCR